VVGNLFSHLNFQWVDGIFITSIETERERDGQGGRKARSLKMGFMRKQLLLLTLGVVGLLGFRSADSTAAVPAPMVPNAPVAAAPAAPSEPVEVADPRAAAVEAALEAFGSQVTGLSHDDALKLAFTAYYNFKAAHPDEVRKPYLYFVDFGLNNRTPRGYVFDMDRHEVIDGPFIVAHGRGSSASKNGVPLRFTNQPGSASTSLGLYVAKETYGFSGKSAGRHYTSIGLRMDGQSGRFNSAARARGVVVHGAPYVTPKGSGRSEGCPAMEQSRARRLIPMIANGGVVFHFSPNDQRWLESDPWINGAS
jgi:hypothetical protein